MKSRVLALVLGATICASGFAFSSCGGDSGVQVYAPDGAPALALAKLLAEDISGDGIDYTITSAAKIVNFVTGRKPQAEVCILPVNEASKLLGGGDTYQMIGLATHGNMYLLSSTNYAYTQSNAGELCGKKIGVVQLPNVPGLALRAALSDLQVPYNLTGVSSDSAYLYGIAPTAVSPMGGADLYLCPEPAASTKIKAFSTQGLPFYTVGSLQELYGGGGYPQACIVAKKSFIGSAEFLKILDGLKGAQGYLQSASIETICASVSSHLEEGAAATFSVQNLTYEVVERCSVRFEASVDCRQKVDGFLQKLAAIAPDSVSAVSQDFYYIEG